MGYALEFDGPLVITKIPSVLTDAEQLEYFQRIEREVMGPRKPYVSMIVAGQARVWTPEQRKRHVAFHKQHQEAIRELCAASAMVMPEVSMIVRFALSTVMMMSPGSPTQIFRYEHEARSWLEGYTSKFRRPVSARPRA